MNELANVIYQTEAGDYPGILGSRLHEALGIMTDYRHWFQRICLRLELKEGRDFPRWSKKSGVVTVLRCRAGRSTTC